MKFAALSAKDQAGDPTVAPADEVFAAATRAGAQAFGIDAGAIRPGLLADCLLVRSRHPLMTPNFHLLSNLVYSADSSCIDTVICDGRILMQRGAVPGEEEILDAAEAACRRLAAV
jgi:5-methylthioadenosine/S-adenosylhomocysteine deaminase